MTQVATMQSVPCSAAAAPRRSLCGRRAPMAISARAACKPRHSHRARRVASHASPPTAAGGSSAAAAAASAASTATTSGSNGSVRVLRGGRVGASPLLRARAATPQLNRRLVAVAANPGDGGETEEDRLLRQRGTDQLIIGSIAIGLTASTILGYYFFAEDIADWLLEASLSDGDFGPGDAVGAVLWGTSFWFASPLQMLLLFLGNYDNERPSDRLMRTFGSVAQLPIDAIDYVAPAWVRGATASVCAAFGGVAAFSLGAGLGDATWSVSTGIGACMLAGMYEAGRPERLSTEDAQTLEAQWVDFESFAASRLVRVGRCHESEVFSAFRRQWPKYRREEVISDAVLRDMLRNWHPDMARTSTGYLKNVSVLQRVDPFTLEVSGTAVRNGAPAEAAAAGGGGGGGGGEQPAGKQASAEPAPVLQRPAA